MSSYENPPSDPYGASPQGPQSPQSPYGASPQVTAGPPTHDLYGRPIGLGSQVEFASWGQRAGAYLIDLLVSLVGLLPMIVGLVMLFGSIETTTDPLTGVSTSEPTGGTGTAMVLIILGGLLSVAINVWNIILKQGKSGYSVGKGMLGIKLVTTATGQPIGAGMAFLRYLVTQAISAVTCGFGSIIDLLWPLWDPRRQTLHDKAVGSVVINQPKA